MVDSSPLANRHCVIVADNDDKGRKHVQQVAADLYGKAASVKTLELPGLAEHGDVSDWLDRGGDVGQPLAPAAAAPNWSPDPSYGPFPSTNGDGARHFEPPRLLYTELGLAERLVESSNGEIRFCQSMGSWLIWNGQRWERDRRDAIMSKAKAVVKSLFNLGEIEDREERHQRLPVCESMRDSAKTHFDGRSCQNRAGGSN